MAPEVASVKNPLVNHYLSINIGELLVTMYVPNMYVLHTIYRSLFRRPSYFIFFHIPFSLSSQSIEKGFKANQIDVFIPVDN